MYKTDMVLHAHVLASRHGLISLDGHLTGHVEVGIHVEHRVEGEHIRRFLHSIFSSLLLHLRLHIFQCGDTSRPPVAALVVVFKHRQILLSFVGNYAQQVAPEYIGVSALHHHRFECPRLCLAKHIYIGDGSLAIFCSLRLVSLLVVSMEPVAFHVVYLV